MEERPVHTIKLDFMLSDGKHETTALHNASLAEARRAADTVFRQGNNLYLEVEISTDGGYSEIISNLYPTVADLERI